MAIARTIDRRLFFVLDRAFLKLAQSADQKLSEGSGIGRAQAAVLVYLGYHDGCTLSELAEGTGRKNAAISGLVDRMEASGLILRKQSYGDRRQKLVFLSLTRGLSELETAAVMKFLDRSVKNVSR